MEPIAPASPFAIPPPPAPIAKAPTFMLPARMIRAGQVTVGWSRFLLVTWLFAVASFIAIWVSSRNTGLSTWWLGPETEPRFILINLLPFVAPVVVCLTCQFALRRLPWIGIAAALVTAAIAAGDISRVPGYAVAEFAVAAGGLLASLACFAGVLHDEPS